MSNFVRPKRLGSWLRRHSLTLVAAVGGAAGVAYAAARHVRSEGPPAVAQAVQAGAMAEPPSGEMPRDTAMDTVQIVLVLDTSSSMDGLINQARAHLWKMVDDMGKMTRVVDGKVRGVKIEIALYEYGNDTLARADGFIRQVLPFTGDLDTVSEKLHGLFTNGGSEYAGQAIQTAVTSLPWSNDVGALRFVFLAGNEEFDQGPVTAAQAMAAAAAKDISVQLILCGGNDENTWKPAALLAQSDLLTIDQNRVAAHVPAPQDDEILRLGQELNGTYVAYGANGQAAIARQATADAASAKMSAKVALERSQLKAKKAYRNESWDLVDAVEKDAAFLGKAKDADLPAELRGKTVEEKQAAVAAKAKARAELKGRLGKLEADRAAFLEAERLKKGGAEEVSLETEFSKSTKKAAAKKGYKP